MHPNKSTTDPYYTIALKPDGNAIMFHDTAVAYSTVDKLKSFDADDRIFVVLCHDHTLKGLINVFPDSANDWKEKNWKEATKWKFLAGFEYQ